MQGPNMLVNLLTSQQQQLKEIVREKSITDSLKKKKKKLTPRKSQHCSY